MPAINNPSNNFTIAKTKEDIFTAVQQIALKERNKYSIANVDNMLNRIRLRQVAIIGNNGYNIEFAVKKISDTESDVTITTSRERGGLDTEVEVNNANYILKEVTDKFSSYLSGNLDEKGLAKIPKTGSGCMVFVALIALVFALSMLFTSCNKDKVNCYECKGLQQGSTSYQDAGCMTAREWDDLQFTDQSGNAINKQNCRRK